MALLPIQLLNTLRTTNKPAVWEPSALLDYYEVFRMRRGLIIYSNFRDSAQMQEYIYVYLSNVHTEEDILVKNKSTWLDTMFLGFLQ